jgi:hypothetical protein
MANGLLFGLFHLSPWRLLPTALLGTALAWLAWRSRSIVPAVVAHLLNNTALVLLARAGVEERLDSIPAALQAALLAGAASLSALGFWAAGRAARRAPPQAVSDRGSS